MIQSHFSTIRDLAPLLPDAPADAPEKLADALYGELDARHCFAILDAAKFDGLPELLAGQDLRFQCLFQGNAAQELRDAAPWLVQLDPKAPFARALFSQDPADPRPWLHWGKDAGVYLRSTLEFDAVWRHLRKFTRVMNADGKWFYHRFWDAQLLQFLAIDFPNTEWVPGVWHLDGGARVISVVGGEATVLDVPAERHGAGRNSDARLFEVMARYGTWSEAGRVWNGVGRPDGGSAKGAFQDQVMAFCNRYGFRNIVPIQHVAECLMHTTAENVITKFASRLPVHTIGEEKLVALAMRRTFVKQKKETFSG